MKKFLSAALIIALFSSCMNNGSNRNLSVTINKALEETNKRFDEKNQMLYAVLVKAKLNDEKAAGPFYEKAMEVKKKSTAMSEYLQEIKDEVNSSKISENKIPADELKDKMEKYFEEMFAFVPAGELSVFRNNYPAEDFSSLSLVMLTKFQNDVISLENDVVTLFTKQIAMNGYKFDMLKVLVVPQSTSIHPGEKYSASIYLAALNSTSNPEIVLGDVDENTGEIIGNGDAKSVVVQDGIGKYEVIGQNPGSYKLSGVIRVKKPDGTYNSFPFKTQYEVVK